MTEFKFRVLPGGLQDAAPGQDEKQYEKKLEYPVRRDALRFCRGWVTDTRLMGVVCMGLEWENTEPGWKRMHQYFYFDAIEFGFDRFEYLLDGTEPARTRTENSFIGGLGAEKIAVTENQAVHLFHEAVRISRRHQVMLPEGREGYDFLLRSADELSEKDRLLLFRMTCVRHMMRNRAELANYYIMRACEHDEEGLRYLSGAEENSALFPGLPLQSFYQNEVETDPYGETALCRALTGYDDNGIYRYRLHVIRLTFGREPAAGGMSADIRRAFRELLPDASDDVTRAMAGPDMVVTGAEVVSSMEISDQEAYLNLSHKEYVTVYQYNGIPNAFGIDSTELTKRAMYIDEEDGYSLMIYHQDNNHVAKKSYHLYDDLMGIYHITGSGQLILSASTYRDSVTMELNLVASPVNSQLTMEKAYVFNEPVMNMFLESGESDFNAFLEQIIQK